MSDPIKEDFRNFLYVAWEFLGYTPNDLQYDMAHTMQNGPDRQIITALRGAGKSVETAALAVWILLNNPNATILCVSAAAVRAREFIRFARKLLEMPMCQHLIPKEFDRDGAERFDCGARTTIDKNPSVAAYGINAMITGTHVDFIILDDIETKNNSLTIDARDKLHSQCLEFEMILNPGGRILYLGTPQSISSVYLRLATKYKMTKWPARYPEVTDPIFEMISPMLKDKLINGIAQPGDPTFPEKFDDITLMEREASMGPTEWQLQMMLNTQLADASKYPLRARDFVVFNQSGDLAPKQIVGGTNNPLQIECAGLDGDKFYGPNFVDPTYDTTGPMWMYVDPAGRGGDETGISIGCCLNGYVYVRMATGIPGGHDDASMMKIAKLASDHNVKRIVIEPNYGDGMFTKNLYPHVLRTGNQIAIEDDKRATTQKELRIIEALEAPMSNKRIIIGENVAKDTEFIYQVTHLTRTSGNLKHDDRVDAFAGLIRLFKDQLQIDAASKIKTMEDAERMKQVKDFEVSWMNSKNGRKVYRGSPEDPHMSSHQSHKGRWGRKSFGW